MKIFNFLLCVMTMLAGAFFCVVFFGSGTAEAWQVSSAALGTKEYAFLCVVHFSHFLSLLLSLLSIAAGIIGTILGFVFKSWVRAFTAAGCAVMAVIFWLWLMEVTI